MNQLYTYSVLAVQFVFPLLVLAYCYGRLRSQVPSAIPSCPVPQPSLEVNESVRRRLTQRLTEAARARVMERQAKTSKMTTMLFLGFIGPWLPFNQARK